MIDENNMNNGWDDEGWEDIPDENRIIKWTWEGQTVKGIWIGSQPAGNKKTPLHSFQGQDGQPFKVWETLKLKEFLSKCQKGYRVQITYEGKDKQVLLFHVKRKPGPSVEG
jgi:hypothetical protein